MPSEITIKILTWILGGLFVFAGGVAGLIIRLGLLMFTWRREIDDKIAESNTKIGQLEQWKTDHIIEALRTRDELKIQREKIMEIRRKNGWT